MKRDTPSYHGDRFPPEIISHAVWLYHRFGVSFRDVEDLLVQRGITVSYEAIRLWCLTFGSEYARRLRRRQGRLGDIWHQTRSSSPSRDSGTISGSSHSPPFSTTSGDVFVASAPFARLSLIRFGGRFSYAA